MGAALAPAAPDQRQTITALPATGSSGYTYGVRRLEQRSTCAWLLTVAALALPACDTDDGAAVTGLLVSNEGVDLTEYGDIVHLRAVPDYIDGFSPDRPYRGGRVLEASCPLEHTEFPVDYILFGDERHVDGAPPRWIVLGWIGDDEDETWVSEGQRYGVSTFEFRETSYGTEWAEDVVVTLDQVFATQ